MDDPLSSVIIRYSRDHCYKQPLLLQYTPQNTLAMLLGFTDPIVLTEMVGSENPLIWLPHSKLIFVIANIVLCAVTGNFGSCHEKNWIHPHSVSWIVRIQYPVNFFLCLMWPVTSRFKPYPPGLLPCPICHWGETWCANVHVRASKMEGRKSGAQTRCHFSHLTLILRLEIDIQESSCLDWIDAISNLTGSVLYCCWAAC